MYVYIINETLKFNNVLYVLNVTFKMFIAKLDLCPTQAYYKLDLRTRGLSQASFYYISILIL